MLRLSFCGLQSRQHEAHTRRCLHKGNVVSSTGKRSIVRVPKQRRVDVGKHRPSTFLRTTTATRDVTTTSPGQGSGSQQAPKPAPGPATSNSPYPWFEQWYPAVPLSYLDPKKPTHVSVLGLSLVVWSDDKGAWHCMEDRCAHRLAPLSEGRVEGGQLMCSYHGWRFDSQGSCTKIPQIVDDAQHAAACASPRSCVKAYPTQVLHGLLWVWPQTGADSALRAAATKPSNVLPELLDTSPDNIWYQRTAWFMRDLPLRFDTLVENVLDPSHVPFAHHGLQGNRNKVAHREMVLQDNKVDRDTGFTVIMEPPAAAPGSGGQQQSPMAGFKSSFSFVPPALARYRVGPFGAMDVYAVPTKPGWTRLLATFMGRKDSKMPLPIKLVLGLTEGFTPIEHALVRNGVLDGDTYMLHVAERELLSKGNNWSKEYYMPATADSSVVAWRRWLRDYGGDVPTCTEADTAAMPPLMSREQVLDRYSQHTAHCKDCKQAVNKLDQLSMACVLGAAVALFTLVARAVAGAPLLSPATAWAAGAMAAAALVWKVLQRVRSWFFFTDYVHAERN